MIAISNGRARTVTLLALLVTTFSASSVQAQAAPAKSNSVRDIRYVVVHKPGPRWKAGVPAFEQAGLQAHIDYYRTLLAAHKLAMGGPFMDSAAGGMMIPAAGVTEADIRKFASADPAIKAGLLIFEVRSWMPTMRE